ncbi:GNAT family N-acetyltransferase [Algicola sagamiensis]|uniref:GNAT family N-acetyltransferase n=1 Tax=Algicola sagamiensis TaxID=163869 RepID=UPI00035D5DE3|nr:GNAT family N-acetyltransferase [Algicola sagamiensis]
MNIQRAVPADYPELLAVWEDSVRATHEFVSEKDIQTFKKIIPEQGFPAVTLYYVQNESKEILGFIGIAGESIEMLFVRNQARGKGIGMYLLLDALENHGCRCVDVNEQNQQAIGFYQHLGFEVISRSPTDGMGKPYPILHMQRNDPVEIAKLEI